MKNSQQHLGNEANLATFSLSHDVIFLMVSPLLGRFLVSFNLQSAICGLQSVVCGLQSAVCSLQSAVCGLQSAVCKCHTPGHGGGTIFNADEREEREDEREKKIICFFAIARSK